jgi:hypothetical protein
VIIMKHKKEKERTHTVKAPVYRGYGGAVANSQLRAEEGRVEQPHQAVMRRTPPPANPYGHIVYRKRVR